MHRFVALFFLALAMPAIASAQDIEVHATRLDADNDRLGSPLFGGGIGIRWGNSGRALSYRVGVERVNGRERRFGIPCAGLIEPNTCLPEPLTDDGRATTVRLGVGVRLLQRTRVELLVGGNLTLSAVTTRSTGEESARTLDASKALVGAEAELLATWLPARRVPLCVQLGVSAARVRPVVDEQIVDGYTPFEQGFAMSAVRLGLVWRGFRASPLSSAIARHARSQ